MAGTGPVPVAPRPTLPLPSEELEEVDLGLEHLLDPLGGVGLSEGPDADAPTDPALSGFKRDKYGFLVTEEDFQELQAYLRKHQYSHPNRVKRWEQMLQVNAPLEPPPAVAAAPGSTKGAGTGPYYRQLLQIADWNGETVRQIRLDTDRTYPNNPLFDTQRGKQQLENVLVAYSCRNPHVGYCQGMNYIAGFLLVMVEEEFKGELGPPEQEEKAFWMLARIIEGHVYNGGYYLNHSQMLALKMDLIVLQRLAKHLVPRVYAHIESFSRIPILAVLVTNWLLTIFTGALPSEALIRVWDAYMLEGRPMLFRVALALIKICEEEILVSTDPVHIINTVRQRAKRLHNCQDLVQVAFYSAAMKVVTAEVVQQMKDDIHRNLDTFLQSEFADFGLPVRGDPAELRRKATAIVEWIHHSLDTDIRQWWVAHGPLLKRGATTGCLMAAVSVALQPSLPVWLACTLGGPGGVYAGYQDQVQQHAAFCAIFRQVYSYDKGGIVSAVCRLVANTRSLSQLDDARAWLAERANQRLCVEFVRRRLGWLKAQHDRDASLLNPREPPLSPNH